MAKASATYADLCDDAKSGTEADVEAWCEKKNWASSSCARF
jgi:hypothetical protein